MVVVAVTTEHLRGGPELLPLVSGLKSWVDMEGAI